MMSQDISSVDERPAMEQLEPAHDGAEDIESMNNTPNTRQTDSRKARASVLIGSAILQLPIWGFAMSYGVFQEYYSSNWTIKGSKASTGVIGTTMNGVMYLSMPIFFGLFTRRWATQRRTAAFCGTTVTFLSFFLSSVSTQAWQLVMTQGVLAALGGALIYSPSTLSLGEWFTTSNRSVAYGVVLSCKNIVGSVCPFIFRSLLDRYGLSTTLKVWSAIAAGSSILGIFLIPNHPSVALSAGQRSRKLSWQFLKHQTFYIYSVAIIFQSSGYGIPQTYLNTYAHDVSLLSQTSATLLLTLFNIPGILASSFFGYLSDNKRLKLSVTTITSIPPISSALSTLLLWGFTTQGSLALLIVFSVTFGFFAGGYSATWGGVINQFEREAAQRNEPVDPGMLYGMLNGARGIGYVAGGLASVPLLKTGGSGLEDGRSYGYGSVYGALIIFTGLSSAFGGWGLLWKVKTLLLCCCSH